MSVYATVKQVRSDGGAASGDFTNDCTAKAAKDPKTKHHAKDAAGMPIHVTDFLNTDGFASSFISYAERL